MKWINSMKNNKIKHYKDEDLLAFVSGSIESKLEQDIRNHLDDCDECFMAYADMKFTHTQLIEYSPSNIPEHIIDDILSEKKIPVIETNGLFDTIKAKLFSPALAPIAAMLALFAFLLRSPSMLKIANEEQGNATINESRLDDVFVEDSFIADLETMEQEEDFTQDLNSSSGDLGRDIDNDVLEDGFEFGEVLAILDIEDKEFIQMRNLSRPTEIPDLSNFRSLDELKKQLRFLNIRCVIYKSKEFKQIPKKGRYLRSDDTLKVYFPF